MVFNNAYFEDEVRDGFFVPSEMKRAWAAELEVLSEIDKICKKHNIQYFADWGTLLAAVRHEGFIPWDDDLDITMKREDYHRFMEIAQTELPEGFFAYDFRNHDDFWLFCGRVAGKRRICFEEDHLERFHQFPYIAGVDIFVMDFVSKDKEAERKRNELALRTIAIADMVGEGKIHAGVMEHELEKLEQACTIHIPRDLSNIEMRKELYKVVEILFGWFTEDEADELTLLVPFGLKSDEFRIPKKCYEQTVELPFENIRIPAPINYHEILVKEYGDYMKPVRDSEWHDYPFFEKQKRQLQEVLDFPMPEYRFSEEQICCKKINGGYKQILKDYINDLKKSVSCLEHVWHIREKQQDILEKLQKMQQTAIEMGTLIETVKGEGTQTVKQLEDLCELIYECSVVLGQLEDISANLEKLQSTIIDTERMVQAEILSCKEAVIYIEKAEHWKYIEWYWKKLCMTENTDINIVPIPYYYKKYDGICYASKNEFGEIEQYVKKSIEELTNEGITSYTNIVDYRMFDIRMHHPWQIIIQNPYDEWNQARSLPEEFYSRNLQLYTENLVYIVPFHVEEFTKSNGREYHNMKYYCTVPGVVRADVVYVQSSNMREVYIQKLTDFAGLETKEIWEKKIAVAHRFSENSH